MVEDNEEENQTPNITKKHAERSIRNQMGKIFKMKNRLGSQLRYIDFIDQKGGAIQIYRGKRTRGAGFLSNLVKSLGPLGKRILKQQVKKHGPSLIRKAVSSAPAMLARLTNKDPNQMEKRVKQGMAIGKAILDVAAGAPPKRKPKAKPRPPVTRLSARRRGIARRQRGGFKRSKNIVARKRFNREETMTTLGSIM